MIRRIFAAAALFAVAHTGGAMAQTVWQGEVFLTSVTSPCTPNAVGSVGDFYRVIYRPKLTGASTADALAFVGSRSDYLVTSATGSATLQGSGTYKGTYISSHASTGSTTGAFQLTILPAPVTASALNLTITGTITNFFAVTGCDIGIRAALTQRVG